MERISRPTYRRRHVAVMAGSLVMIGAGVVLAMLGLSPEKPAPTVEAAQGPPMSDPNVDRPSALATQPPGPLVPLANAPEITIAEPTETLDGLVRITGTAWVSGRTVRILIINSEIGMTLDDSIEVRPDGSFSIKPEFQRTAPLGTRSVIRISGVTSDGRNVETNREVTQR